MKQSLLTVASMLCALTNLSAQNLISNPGFELGSIPTDMSQIHFATGWNNKCGTVYNLQNGSIEGTPDLIDDRSTDPCIDFTNRWTNLNERTGGHRYAGFKGGTFKTSNNTYYYGETVEGSLTQALVSGCTYNISFYGANFQGNFINCSTSSPQPANLSTQYNKIEVVLRKDDNCTSGKSVFISPTITGTSWSQYSGQFILSAADAAVGYNRIEFRFVSTPSFEDKDRWLFIDDVNLSLQPGAPISSDFSLDPVHIPGNNVTFILQATVANVPANSGFFWEVSEIDPITGVVIPGTTMTNPSNWWVTSLYYTNTFPGYYGNTTTTTGNGTFYRGRTYRVTRGTWGPCTPWASTSKIVYYAAPRPENSEPVEIIIKNDSYQMQAPTELLGFQENNYTQKSDLIIYPNPSKEVFNIQTTNETATSFEVYDLYGRMILSDKIINGNGIIDLSSFSIGAYCVKISSLTGYEIQYIQKN